MKTASKVFLIIDLVWKGLCICLVFVMVALSMAMSDMEASTEVEDELTVEDELIASVEARYYEIGVIIIGAITIIFLIPIFSPGMISDIIALKKLNHADCKADIPTGLSVCVLIFSNLLAGIFMLSLSDKDFISTTVNQTVSYQNIPPTKPMDDYYRGRSNGNPNAYRNPYPNGNHNIHPDQQ